jgi:hypothetical protein
LSATGTSTSTTRADDADEVLARVAWSIENQSIGESGGKPQGRPNLRPCAGRGQCPAAGAFAS